MILLGMALIGFGWFTPHGAPWGRGPSEPIQIESLISEITNPATPTTLVIVVPNGDETTAPAPQTEPVAKRAVPVAPIAPITPAAQVPVGAPIWVSNPTNQQDLSANLTELRSAAALPTVTYAPVVTVTATLAPDSTKVQVLTELREADTFPTANTGKIPEISGQSQWT